jgi:hypothetical protein
MFHASLANRATEATALSVRVMAFGQVPEIAQQVEKPYHTHRFLELQGFCCLYDARHRSKPQRTLSHFLNEMVQMTKPLLIFG